MFEAMFNNVVVKLDPSEIKEVGNLAIAGVQGELSCIGTIVSVGPTVLEPLFKDGVKVIVPPTGVGEIHRVGSDNYLILFDFEIYGIINE